ncbi:hypothetical protein [Streptomyces sp. NPDC058086]
MTTITTGPLLHRFHPAAGPLSVQSVEAARTCTAKTDRGLATSQDDTN